MRVFVLGTGRCGTTTFVRACSHLENFTVGHETRASMVGDDRFAYPESHIEADNRLSWFLGELAFRFDDTEVLFVHLRRDPDATAQSFLRRWDSPWRASIIRAFAHGIVTETKDHIEPMDVCRFYVDTVTANISEFLVGRPSMELWLEKASDQFPAFLSRIGSSGDLDGAISEWSTRHNAST